MSDTKINITFVLPSLVAGGAERVISFIAQNIDAEKFNSTILITGHQKDTVYPIENIKVEYLEKKRVLNAVSKLFMYLTTRKPDVVLSSIGHLNTVMGLMSPCFPKIKFVIREASVVSAMNSINRIKRTITIFNKLRSVMSHLSYKLVDNIICQSKDMADDFIAIYKVPKQKLAIINNPITQTLPLFKVKEPSSEIVKFITVGRLSEEKGQLRILKLLSKLKFKFHYTIIGTGPLKTKIFEAIQIYNLTTNITYIPFTSNISKYMSSSDLFLQGSYVEGFPNTVLESCFFGTPVLAFNVPGGTKEIIIHKENGYLAETEEEYEFYLNNRLNLTPTEIRKSVTDRFDKLKIIKQYETLFTIL